MHTRLLGTSILALTLAAVLSAACTENPGATGTTGTGVGVRVSQIDMGRSLNADKTINDNTDSFKPNDAIYASIVTEGSAATATLKARWTYRTVRSLTNPHRRSHQPATPERSSTSRSRMDRRPESTSSRPF